MAVEMITNQEFDEKVLKAEKTVLDRKSVV